MNTIFILWFITMNIYNDFSMNNATRTTTNCSITLIRIFYSDAKRYDFFYLAINDFKI